MATPREGPEPGMSQHEIDEAEWHDSANWNGGRLGISRSEFDTRAWVPKRDLRLGVTVKFARRAT